MKSIIQPKMKSAFLGICLCLIGGQAFAQSDRIQSFDIAFEPLYTQTTDNTLGPLQTTAVFFYLNTSNANDLSAVTVTTPSSSTFNLVLNSQYSTWTQSTSQGDLNVNGTYTFQTTGNVISSQTYNFTASGSFPTPLELTGTSIENLAAANGSAPVNLTVNYYSYASNLTWNLFNAATHAFVDGEPLTSTSFTLPASDITPGQSYLLTLNGNVNSQGGTYNSAPSQPFFFEYNPSTDITFGVTATPEPSVFVLLLLACAGGLGFSVVKKARLRAAKIA